MPPVGLVDLEVREELYRFREPMPAVYFPLTAVVSMLTRPGGRPAPVEVATVGFEGMVGLPVFLGVAVSPTDACRQVPGRAARLPVAGFRDFLPQMLGVRRSPVSEVAGKPQTGGLITYRRGELEILDRDRLEETACECYRVIKDEFDSLVD